MMESFQIAVLQETEKEKKKINADNVLANYAIFKIVLIKHTNAYREFLFV